MNHETDEALSALIDRQSPPKEATRIRAHLESCERCQGRLAAFERVRMALSSLEEPQLTPAERRALRQQILKPRRRLWSPRVAWGMAGAAASMLIAFAVISTLAPDRSQDRSSSAKRAVEADSQLAAGGAESLDQDFKETEEIRAAVSSNRRVIDGLLAYSVEDVGSLQSAAVTGLSRSAGSPEDADQAVPAPAQGRSSSPGPSLRQCIESVFVKQPYALMPIYSAAASYRGTPVWIMAYAYTTSDDPKDRLDKLLIWVVRQTDCSELVVDTQLRPAPARSASP